MNSRTQIEGENRILLMAGIGILGIVVGSYVSGPSVLVKKDVNGDGRTDYIVSNRLGNETVFYNNREAEYQPIPSSDLAEKLNRLPADYQPFKVEYNPEQE
jgi:hypothetical protein